MSHPIIMHINYCEQGQTLHEACQKAVDWGYDGVEFRQIPRTGKVDPKKYYDEVAAAVQKSGLKEVVFGGPPTRILTPDPKEREEGIQLQERYYRLAAERFDMSVWNARTESIRANVDGSPVTGSRAAGDEHWEWATEAYKRLGKVAEELGFRLAFETHGQNLTDFPDVTKSLCDRIDHPFVGINLDYGNMLRFPHVAPLTETLHHVAERLYYLHLKNGIVLPDNNVLKVGLADGEINNREFIRTAVELGYDGPICVEAPRSGDREWFAQEDLAYLRSVLADLE